MRSTSDDTPDELGHDSHETGVRHTVNHGNMRGPGDPTAAYEVVADGASLPSMVDFRGHDGRLVAIPYRRLISIVMDGESVIELDFPEHRILLRGRNLHPLYSALVQNRVTSVQESDLDVLSESETFVDRIVIAPADAELEGTP
jgi:hypothetical protein